MPVERHIREILEGGESSLLEADMSRRLDMLVRQGLMPVSKLPLLKRGLEKLQLGKVGSPQEREAVSSLLNSMMFIVLGDDTVFNRARQHTQKNRYQAEESENVEECKDEEDFKPHMMYDPKTGKGYMAKKYEDHVKMDKMGYTHDKPKMKEEMDMCDCDCECDGNICETCGLMKPVLEKYDTPAKKKPVSQMSDSEKKANDERRKAYNEFQKKNRMNEEDEHDHQKHAIDQNPKGHKHNMSNASHVVHIEKHLKSKGIHVSADVNNEAMHGTNPKHDYISITHSKAKNATHTVQIQHGEAHVVDEDGESKGSVKYQGVHHSDNLHKLIKKHEHHLKENKEPKKMVKVKVDPSKIKTRVTDIGPGGKEVVRKDFDEENDFRHIQQDSTELNSDGNRDRGRYGEDLTGEKEMFQFQPGNPFAKVKKEMQEGAFKRMATDAEEDDRLKAQKKAARLSKKMSKLEKETDPGLKEAEDKFEELLEKNVPTNPKLWSKFKAQAKAKFDVYPSAYANGWAAKKYKAAGGSWRSESVEFDELVDQLDEYITSKQVKMAKGIAFDKRHKGGDMTGAAKKMEKIKKGLSNHPGAQKALRQANEGVFDDYTDEELDELIEMEYKAKFQAMLKKSGKSLSSMSPDEKKKFFNSVDAAHKAKNESYTMKNTYAKSGAMAKDKESHNTGGFRISNKDAAAAKQRLMQKKGMKTEDAASDAKRDYDADDKKGMAPLKKDKPAKVSSASNAKEIEHIVPQLRKAITVGKEVQFQDGKTQKVSKGHAAKFLNKYMNSKPAQKADMQSSAHKSHDHFMKHV